LDRSWAEEPLPQQPMEQCRIGEVTSIQVLHSEVIEEEDHMGWNKHSVVRCKDGEVALNHLLGQGIVLWATCC